MIMLHTYMYCMCVCIGECRQHGTGMCLHPEDSSGEEMSEVRLCMTSISALDDCSCPMQTLPINCQSYILPLCMCVFVKEFDVRKLACAEGHRYCNATALIYQVERMPEQIRVNVRIVYRVEYTCTYMCNDVMY